MELVGTPWFWLGMTVLFTGIELVTAFTLTTIWFAIAAGVMVFISGATEPLDPGVRFRLHIGLFLGISVVLLIFTRPFALKKLKIGREKTNVRRLIGEPALVTKAVGRFSRGEITVAGQIWTAVAEDAGEIEAGAECIVVNIEGVKAVVRRT